MKENIKNWVASYFFVNVHSLNEFKMKTAQSLRTESALSKILSTLKLYQIFFI